MQELVFREPALFHHGLHLVDVRGVAIDDGHDLRSLELPDLDVHEREAFFLDLLIETFEEALSFLFVGLHDLFLEVDVLLALKELRDLLFESLHQRACVLFERSPGSRLEPHEDGGFGVLEAVHVAEVVGRPLFLGDLFQHLPDGGHSAGPCRPVTKTL